MTSENNGLVSLIGIWNSVSKNRLETYNYTGILHFERDTDGVVHEKYFRSFDDFVTQYPDLKINGLMVDLTKRD